jgi:DUF971 family protein
MDYPADISNSRADGALTIIWRDGTRQQWPHALLRAHCKCTHCQSQRLLAVAPEAAPAALRVEQLRMIGNYGLQLVFSDGHERGIYPWSYLRSLSADAQSESRRAD